MFMLSEAVLSVQRTGLPYLTILIDDSASARIADQYEKPEVKAEIDALAAPAQAKETTRLAIAQGLILKDHARLLRELEKQHNIRIYLVSTATRLLAEIDRPAKLEPALDLVRKIEPTGAQSRLGDGVRYVLTELRGAPPSAVVLLSDGQTTEGEPLSKASELAARKGVPLFAVGLGSAEPARDIELTELLVDDVVFVDDTVRFQAKLLARGFKGEKVVVRLKERDPTAPIPTRRDRSSPKKWKPRPTASPAASSWCIIPRRAGERTFILEVEPRPRELQTDNNRIERQVNVRKEKLKVLLVDSDPRYEFRYLKNYLERDETIDLNVVLTSSDPAYSEEDRSALPTFPAAKEDLFAYDVVLFGDADLSFLSRVATAESGAVRDRERGRRPVHRRRDVQPLGLSRHAARALAADRALRRPQPDCRREPVSAPSGPS